MEESSKTTKNHVSFRKSYKQFSFWKPYIGAALGGVLGFLYYYFIGCSSGSCAITSNPFLSVLLGGFLGFFAMNCQGNKC